MEVYSIADNCLKQYEYAIPRQTYIKAGKYKNVMIERYFEVSWDNMLVFLEIHYYLTNELLRRLLAVTLISSHKLRVFLLSVETNTISYYNP